MHFAWLVSCFHMFARTARRCMLSCKRAMQATMLEFLREGDLFLWAWEVMDSLIYHTCFTQKIEDPITGCLSPFNWSSPITLFVCLLTFLILKERERETAKGKCTLSYLVTHLSFILALSHTENVPALFANGEDLTGGVSGYFLFFKLVEWDIQYIESSKN